MDKKNLFEDWQSRISQIVEQTPVRDIEKNLRALITQALSRLDMVPREEYEAQALLLSRLREQVSRLEARIDKLEKQQEKPAD
ncbi:MAG: accessory factor UbiK family protein [Oxalobacter formigenes]|nr:accessory factor UbiK family protein [Oxalobacter formigenes]